MKIYSHEEHTSITGAFGGIPKCSTICYYCSALLILIEIWTFFFFLQLDTNRNGISREFCLNHLVFIVEYQQLNKSSV
jgi:hypothetical protein